MQMQTIAQLVVQFQLCESDRNFVICQIAEENDGMIEGALRNHLFTDFQKVRTPFCRYWNKHNCGKCISTTSDLCWIIWSWLASTRKSGWRHKSEKTQGWNLVDRVKLLALILLLQTFNGAGTMLVLRGQMHDWAIIRIYPIHGKA